MARICAVCKQPPREGQEMRPIRIREHQYEAAKELFPLVEECALYSSCLECVEKFRQLVADEQGKDITEITNYMMC